MSFFHENRSFPGWSGPLVGAFACVLFTLKTADWHNPSFEFLKLGIAAAGGAGAGSLMLLRDANRAKQKGEWAPDPPLNSGSTLGRVLAVLSLIVWIAPFVGLVWAVGALVANRRVRGWPKVVSWVGLALALVVSGITGMAILIMH